MENPIKLDDLGGPPLFLETPTSTNRPAADFVHPVFPPIFVGLLDGVLSDIEDLEGNKKSETNEVRG